jgi:YidC/Oxa1 family membrane protein insertase
MMFVPLISIFYGGFLPAGLFIYWIVSTLFSIVQQYLILGWGGMFPIFGWFPSFAKDHTPRFPVAVPAADPTKRAPTSVLTTTDERAARAASTVRPRERSGRSSRRGRRR